MKYSKAIAANTDFLTAQAFVFEKDNLLACLLISASGEDIFTKARIAGLSAQDLFLSLEDDIPGRIEKVAEFLRAELVGAREVHILIASLKENALYLQGQGRGLALLLRDEKTINLLTQSDQLISGFLIPGDKLLLTSARMVDIEVESPHWSEDLIVSLFKSPLEELEDQLEMYLQSSGEMSPVAVVLFENEVAEAPPIAQPVKTTPPVRKIRLINLNRKTRFITLGVVVVLLGLGLFYGLNAIKERARVKPLDDKDENLSAQILNVYQVSDWPLFLSLDLIKKDFSSDKLSYSIGEILVLDHSQKSLVAIDTVKKSNQVLAGANNLGQATVSSINGDKAFAFSAEKGVYRVDLITEKGTLATKPDDAWGKIVDIYAFGGNFYLLDSLKNQIWKYVPIESGYAEKSGYIQSENADLAGATRLQIDASVWVLKNGPEIIKYTNGSVDSFSVSGLDRNLGKVKSFFVSSDTEKIYFLDTENSRVVVLGKGGNYYSQYLGDKFATADDLVVDEADKKIYLLESNKIYQIELK